MIRAMFLRGEMKTMRVNTGNNTFLTINTHPTNCTYTATNFTMTAAKVRLTAKRRKTTPKASVSKEEEVDSNATLEATGEAVVGAKAKRVSDFPRRNQMLKEIQANESSMDLLIECAIDTEYWWDVCDGVKPETIGSKLAKMYNDIMGNTGEDAITWREANRCFRDFKRKFISDNREGTWADLLSKEKKPSLRRTILNYLVGEEEYKQKVLNGEIPVGSDVEVSSSDDDDDNDNNGDDDEDDDDDDDHDDDDDDVVLLPSPAPSPEERKKTAPRRSTKPSKSTTTDRVKKKTSEVSKSNDKVVKELTLKLDRLEREYALLRTRSDEQLQENVRLRSAEDRLMTRVKLFEEREASLNTRLSQLESRFL